MTGVGLQLIRLTVVPAFYMLYRDVWYQTGAVETAREGLPAVLNPLAPNNTTAEFHAKVQVSPRTR